MPEPDGLAIRWSQYFSRSEDVCGARVCARSDRYRRRSGGRPRTPSSASSPASAASSVARVVGLACRLVLLVGVQGVELAAQPQELLVAQAR